MIVAQERGIDFVRLDEDYDAKIKAVWEPVPAPMSKAGDAFEDVELSLGLQDYGYGSTLTREGEAFRQRFVDYVPPQEGCR